MSVPRGAHWDGTKTLFTLDSVHATRVDLCFFEGPESAVESQRLSMVRSARGLWRLEVEGVGPGTLYGYRVHGPYAPQEGHRFNPAKLLVDPFARAITGEPRLHRSLFGHHLASPHPISYNGEDSAASMPKCVVVNSAFDWQNDQPPRTPWQDTVIYECHVKGLTQQHPQVPPALRGTYLGLAQPSVLEHLRTLGVTAVELLPVHQIASEPHLQERGLHNYWGYSPLGFFAPHAGYATQVRGEQVVEFKTMVRRLHRAGLEIFLDVVFNHTAEGDHRGPTLSLRGIDNRSYYRLHRHSEQRYLDHTGCGNSLDCSLPATRRLILDSLRYWVTEMHVDGFRFDLATTLGRTTDGDFSTSATLFEAIENDPLLAHVKLIAEPWDLGPEGYRLGDFPPAWGEWNDRYRDTVRRFWRGDGGTSHHDTLLEMAQRLNGSRDVFKARGRGFEPSINYVVSHDGFTLADMVSYEHKHNEANGEDNRDGTNNNSSHNWGAEGPTEEADIVEARRRAQRNLFATLAFSRGVPMLYQGDELGFSQRGNNNPYCQDNRLTWLRWSADEVDGPFLSFARRVLALRRKYPELRTENDPDMQGVEWYHPAGREMTDGDWSSSKERVLGMKYASSTPLLLLLNGGTKAIDFHLPDGSWEALLETTCENQPVAPSSQVGTQGGTPGRSPGGCSEHPDHLTKPTPMATPPHHHLEGFSLALLKRIDSPPGDR